MSHMDDNKWECEEPDKPHVVTGDMQFCGTCHLCGEKVDRGICFVHNEGCHDVICRVCIRRMGTMLEGRQSLIQRIVVSYFFWAGVKDPVGSPSKFASRQVLDSLMREMREIIEQ